MAKGRPKVRGGAKKSFRNKKEYKNHLREMAKQGKCTEPDGNWSTIVSNPGMSTHLKAGYKIH